MQKAKKEKTFEINMPFTAIIILNLSILFVESHFISEQNTLNTKT